MHIHIHIRIHIHIHVHVHVRLHIRLIHLHIHISIVCSLNMTGRPTAAAFIDNLLLILGMISLQGSGLSGPQLISWFVHLII